MEAESGFHFKFYFENVDKFGRVLPNNLSKQELDEYTHMCSKTYDWYKFIEEGKTKKVINTFYNWIKENNLLSFNIEDENLIYLCEAFTPPEFYQNKFIENLSEPVLKKLKTKKLMVIFNWFSEPLHDPAFNRNIKRLCDENGFNILDFYLFTSANNIQNQNYIEHISDHFFIKSSADFLKNFLQSKIFKPNSFDYVCEIVGYDIFQKTKSKHFMSLNRHVDRPHRYGLGMFIEKNNLWEKGYFSFLVCDKQKNGDELQEALSITKVKEYKEYNDKFFQKIPIQIDTNFLNPGFELYNFGTSNIYYKPIYEQSIINIVTETTFTSNKVFLSEKTFHPIINLQPFLFFASNGQLAELKRLGFKTFEHIIDESYDDEPNSQKRFEMVCNEILRLSNLSTEEMNELYLSCKDICIHNRKHLLTFSKYDVFKNSLQKLKEKQWSLQEKKLL